MTQPTVVADRPQRREPLLAAGGHRRTALGRVAEVALLPVLLAGVGVAEIWVPFPSVLGSGSPAWSTVVVLATCAALGLRHRAPLTGSLLTLGIWPAVFTVQPLLVLFWGQFVPMAAAVFAVARHGRGRTPFVGAAAGAVVLLYFDLRVDVLQSPGEIVFHWSAFTLAWAAGRGLQRWEARARESTRRAVQAEVAAAERALAAVLDERTRIARELHDVVAHAVSVMVVQAGAAEQVVEEDPGYARAALATIRTTGAEALAEMRRVLTILREDGTAGSLAPQPGLDGLASLLDNVREGGLEVRLQVDGAARPLPAGVDLAAYRIAQEALTNVRRHAAATSVRVVVRYTERTVVLEVADDGRGVPDGRPSSEGHGLVGMRERAALYGGELVTSSSTGGGFVVRAELPTEAA